MTPSRTPYGDLLRQAWADHLAPRTADAPTVVSTFAGCGGSSLGYSMAGYRELLAVEWDDHAAACLRRNFPHVPLHHGDITDVDPDVLGLAPGELDVYDGSPPCQGFSRTGHRQIDDPRNQLFRQYVRLLEAWQPKVLVMENVAGMVHGHMRTLFAEILTALKAAGPGYRVIARLMDTSYFHVPQARQRMIFIGVREDLHLDPVHPAPLARPVTVRQAWADLKDPGPYLIPRGKAAVLAPLVPPGTHGGRTLGARGGKRSYFNLARLHYDRPSVTVCKDIRNNQGGLLHPEHNRIIGLRELTRIGSIPDEYDWGTSKYRQVWNRVGNSVPPLFMRAVASTIRDQILAPARQQTATT